MKVTHYFNEKYQIEKEVKEEPGFLLTNKIGSYLWLSSQPISRYQGWFFVPEQLIGKRMFKLIENIEIPAFSKISEIKNNFWSVSRKRDKLEESFFLPSHFNSLVYELSFPSSIELFLDIKESYDNREAGKFYEIFEEKDLTIIKYQQPQLGIPMLFLVIKADGEILEKPGQSVRRNYLLDEERNSLPFTRDVFGALKLNAKKIVFAVAEDKNRAIEQVKYVFENTQKLKEFKKKEMESLKLKRKTKNKKINFAYLCAQNSLSSLTVSANKTSGIFAGLPWFFQFWQRDEAISLLALSKFAGKAAKNIFWRLFDSLEQKDILDSPDIIGLVFKRARDFINGKELNPREIKKTAYLLTKLIDRLLERNTDSNGFALNSAGKTWMDSLERSGARIEIQALRLNLYNLAYELTRKKKYLVLERHLKKQVRERFLRNKILADGFDPDRGVADFTVRPNIFLAAYIYPELLKKNEWIECFENVLPKLWLDWGGFSTIDQREFRFHPNYTGEDPRSYHNGDSWFYLNNLAALILCRFSRKKFKKYIDKTLKASTDEILWRGMVGHHAELSSAEKRESGGCFAQAWSSALYIEAVKEIFNL